MTPKERTEALASDLNQLSTRSWKNGRDYDKAFNATLRSHAVDPNADPTDDVRQVSPNWWVRFDSRLAKWRAIRSEERPPLVATEVHPETKAALRAALAEAKAGGGQVFIAHGDTLRPVKTGPSPFDVISDPIPDRPPTQ